MSVDGFRYAAGSLVIKRHGEDNINGIPLYSTVQIKRGAQVRSTYTLRSWLKEETSRGGRSSEYARAVCTWCVAQAP